jgi:hypothetical protein
LLPIPLDRRKPGLVVLELGKGCRSRAVDQDGPATSGLDGRSVSSVDESGDLKTIAVFVDGFAVVPTHVVDDPTEEASISAEAGNEATSHEPTVSDGSERRPVSAPARHQALAEMKKPAIVHRT